MRIFPLIVLLFYLSIGGTSSAVEDYVFEVETEGRYRMEGDASVDLAKKVALFTAKRKAVEAASKYLSRKNLVAVYELEKDEIHSLAAREIRAEILEEKKDTVGQTLI